MKYEIIRLAKGGEGVSTLGGKVFFVEGGLPGESGEAEIILEKSTYGRAKATTRTTTSPYRREADSCRASCTNCGFRHVKPEDALRLKSEAVYAEIAKGAKVALPAPECISLTGELDGRRRRVRLHIGEGGIGYFARDSHRMISGSPCPIIAPALRAAIQTLEMTFDDAFCTPFRGKADIQLDLDDLSRVFAHIKATEQRILKKHIHRPGMRKAPQQAQISLSAFFPKAEQLVKSGAFAGIRVGDKDFGEAMIRDIVGDENLTPVTIYRRNGDFSQATQEANRHIHTLVETFIKETGASHVADLFSGSGNLSFRAACHAKTVDSYEQFCDCAAFERGCDANKALWNGAAVCLKKRDLELGFGGSGCAADVILTDPARNGMSEALCADIVKSRAKALLYVSCESSCLARDLQRLSSHFEVRRLFFIDMFPQTPLVETVAWLERMR